MDIQFGDAMSFLDVVKKINPVKIIGKVAPEIAKALGRPVAGIAFDYLSDKLGKKVKAVEDIVEYIEGATQPQLADLRKLDQEFLAKMRQMDVDIERINAADRDSARSMQIVALQGNDVFAKRFLYWFAIGWSVVAAIYIVAITFIPIPKDSIRFADINLGFMLGTIVTTIVKFFFGTSSSSSQKTDIMADLMKSSVKKNSSLNNGG